MQISVLGPTQAHRPDGTPVPVGGARLRALLTALALRPGRTVPVAVLVDEVWDGDRPADAVAALQALVGRLRRALGAGAIVSGPGGYRLEAAPDDVDVHRFDRLATEGVRSLEAGDPARALALLGEALALWRDPALADLPDRTAWAARWEARHHSARISRLAAVLALGRAEAALPELAALCDTFPLDEPLHALRIRALRAAGRPAEALAAYEAVRRHLATHLGTAPGQDLRTLHTELLHPRTQPTAPAHPAPAPAPAQPAVPAHAAPGTAPGPSTAPDSGPSVASRAFALPGRAAAVSASGEAAAPRQPDTAADAGAGTGSGGRVAGRGATPQTLPHRPGNLRARLTSFVGREEDIEVVLADLERARLVTLLGPGGAGKTRLSVEAAERGGGRWADGVWVVELAPVTDPDAVPDAVLTALGARETVLRGAGAEDLRAAEPYAGDPLVRLVEHCARRRILVVLDNCEHVVGAAAALTEELLTSCPGVAVLATSREPLAVDGEVVRPVEPLPDPMALRLLDDRGAAARPGFRTDDDPDACAEICRRLDGLPLAIELAAARLRALTPRQIADRLDDRFRLLNSGSRTALPRQQTLRAVVDWSWDLLEPAERTLLMRLSVFSGGCDLDAAETVCDLPGTASLLSSLVDKSLVVAAPTAHGDMRYRLLETVAEYAAERLDEAGDRAAAERRHLVHYRELARTTDPELRGAGQRAALDRLQREYENLRTALRRAVAARDEHEALCLVLSLAWYWQMRGLRADARHWSEAAAALGPDPFVPPVAPAPPLTEGCTDAPPPMRDDLLGEARRQVRLVRLVNMHHHEPVDRVAEDRAPLDRISEAYRPGLPQTCRLPGILWIFAVLITGEGAQLRALLDTTVDTGRALGYDWDLAHALQWRASVFANRGSLAAEATRDADECLEIFLRLGDSYGAAEALSARGEARESRGQYEGAAADYQAAITHAERLGAQAQVSLLRTRYAAVLPELGRGDEAEAILREVIAQGPGGGHEAVPFARLYLSVHLGRTGRTDEARALLLRLREEFRPETVFSLLDGFTLGSLAWLDNLDGQYEDALRRAAQAFRVAREPLPMMVVPQVCALQLVSAARALTGLGGDQEVRLAAVLLGAAEGATPPGHVPSPLERENLEATVTATRAALGDSVYAALFHDQGGGLTLDEAAALLSAHE